VLHNENWYLHTTLPDKGLFTHTRKSCVLNITRMCVNESDLFLLIFAVSVIVSELPHGSLLRKIWTILADLKVVWRAKKIFLVGGWIYGGFD
jgi:hypothetical protein